MIEFLVHEGPEFEAIIMQREINNSSFRLVVANVLFIIIILDNGLKYDCLTASCLTVRVRLMCITVGNFILFCRCEAVC